MKLKLTVIFIKIFFISFVSIAQTLVLKPHITGLKEPVAVENAGDERLIIIEQEGRIKIADTTGQVLSANFLDITDRVLSRGNEQGLLGLAFHPNYKTNGLFFLNYTNLSGATTIAQYKVSENENIAEKSSEKILLSMNQPYANHNGGDLKFGPDGYLYIGTGDGGSAGDPQQNAQNPKSLLGKMLRINVDGNGGYSIPNDNPFINDENYLPEIWSLGLRNPWRYSFDRITGDLWIADVGQDKWEEVDFQSRTSTGGENYGWRCREGKNDFRSNDCNSNATLTDPVFEYANNNTFGCSITGGYVYRGTQNANLFGKYLVTDYCSGNIWFVSEENEMFASNLDGKYRPYNYVAFGEDVFGELYLCERETGVIVKIKTKNCKPKAHFNGLEGPIVWEMNKPLVIANHPNLSYQWFLNGTDLNITDNSIVPVEAGTYACAVSNLKGCTDTARIEISGLTSSIYKNEGIEFEIYPQPAQEILNISINASANSIKSIEIFALNGQLVQPHSTNKNNERAIKMNVSNLLPGFYTLKITGNNGVAHRLVSLE